MGTPYIVKRRARFVGLDGPVNLPYGTDVEAVDGFLCHGERRLCAVTSENAHRYFSTDADGNGLERGALTLAIMAKLEKRDKDHEKRWDRVQRDPVAGKYDRKDHADHWLWGHAFFEAPVEDLRHIAALVNGGR